jgi:hypothetical protein
MLNRWTKLLLAAFLFVPFTAFANAQIWNSVSNKGDLDSGLSRTFSADDTALRQLLNSAPRQHSGQSIEINLPMPDGQLARFELFESSIMEDGLADKFPELKSFKVYGIDDPSASGRIDISPSGLRGMLQTSKGRVFIDPVANFYRVKTRQRNDFNGSFQCSAHRQNSMASSPDILLKPVQSRIAGSLLVYRLALAATQEYVTAVTNAGRTAMAEFVTAINRVNQIYERDFGIQLVLVNNTDDLIDVNGTSLLAGFDSNPLGLIKRNQDWVDNTIGTGNYDIGHVFSTGAGGLATLGSVCDSNFKAEGVTGLDSPIGDVFYIDFVAHEIGHQFGAEHSFNGTEGSCGAGNRNPETAFEPGGGSTIMGYAGICGREDIQSASEATFHAGSIAQINAYVTSPSGSCNFSVTDPGNPNDPIASAGSDFTIPISTAFKLVGTGSDLDNDTISYQWNQMDAGTATDEDSLGDDLGDNALFRVYEPTDTGVRTFPALGTLLNNQFDKSETLPCTTRDMNFRLTVRDGKSGQNTDDVRISVNDSIGPFVITSHAASETIAGGSEATITWDVAGTNEGAVACSTVEIDLLTFSNEFLTYSETSLAVNETNDGSALVTIPDKAASIARLRVECTQNIFFDISDRDLIITGTEPFDTDDMTTTFNNNGIVTSTEAGECAAVSVTTPASSGEDSAPTSGGFNDSPVGTGAFNKAWVFIVLGLFAILSINRRARFIRVT